MGVTVLDLIPAPEGSAGAGAAAAAAAAAATAPAPVDGDLVTCHYVGRVKSTGVIFDSSRAKGEPFELTLGRGSVIRGWEEGLLRVPLGATATLDITSDFGYGADGCESNEAHGSGKIPPNADLLFEVEILDINGARSVMVLFRYRASLDAWMSSKLAAFDGDAKLAAKKGGKHGGRDGYAAFLAASTGKRYAAEKAKHMEGGEEGKT